MSNFYVSSPGLKKPQKDSNLTNPNPIEPEDKKLEGYNFGNEGYNPQYDRSIQGGDGNQQYTYMQSFPQGVSTFPQGGSSFPQEQYQGSYVQQPGSAMVNPGSQLNPLPPGKIPKTLDENIKTLIDVFKGLEHHEQLPGENKEPHDPRSNEHDLNGVDADEIITFLKSARPQLDKEHQDLLTDFLTNIDKNMERRNKINEKDFLRVINNITLRESEKSLNATEMTQLFSQLDKRRRGSFGIDELEEMFRDKFKENGRYSKDEFRKLLGFISPNGEISYEEFFNILNNEQYMNYY